MNDPGALTRLLKEEARRLGFRLSGACPAVAAPGWDHFREWLDAGYAGQMHYLPGRVDAYAHPRSVLDGVRSLLVLGMDYVAGAGRAAGAGEGRVARYAWGPNDYHDVIRSRLNELTRTLTSRVPGALARGVVDTAPLLEREFARLAGLGWIGKNTLLLDRAGGSYFFLAVLLTDQVLDYDLPHQADHCGTCRACLDACPTQAFPQPYVLDATRCISYLTIELRGAIPVEQRESLDPWLFGCDICQEVCPWNSKARGSDEPAFQPSDDLNPVELAALFRLSDDDFRARFRRSPLWRPRRRGILRNAALLLGSRGCPPAALEDLLAGLGDSEPLVRGAVAWALGRSRDPRAARALERQRESEKDDDVRHEIRQALAEHAARTTGSGRK